MGEGLIIREMERADIWMVMEIERRSFITPWSKGIFEECLTSPITKAYVIEKDGAICGYILYYAVLDEAHILNIAVAPSYRKRGIASRLLDYVIQGLKGNGVKECFLEVREEDEDAKLLYKRFGFEVIGRRRGYYRDTREDALMMRLLLPRP
jgi:ribosomal-protein-alanine N-acetyltransferase